MIEVTEYLPTFVDVDRLPPTVVEDEPDILLIPWVAGKVCGRPTRITWDKWNGFLQTKWDDGHWWIIATLKHL